MTDTNELALTDEMLATIGKDDLVAFLDEKFPNCIQYEYDPKSMTTFAVINVGTRTYAIAVPTKK